VRNGAQSLGLRRHGAPVKTQTCSAIGGGDAITDQPSDVGRPQARRLTRPDDQLTSQCSFFPLRPLQSASMEATEAAAFALPGRCSGVTRVISTAVPYHLDMPLSFVLRRPCIWYMGHGRSEANK